MKKEEEEEDDDDVKSLMQHLTRPFIYINA